MTDSSRTGNGVLVTVLGGVTALMLAGLGGTGLIGALLVAAWAHRL